MISFFSILCRCNHNGNFAVRRADFMECSMVGYPTWNCAFVKTNKPYTIIPHFFQKVNNKMKNPVCHFDDFFSFAVFHPETEKEHSRKPRFGNVLFGFRKLYCIKSMRNRLALCHKRNNFPQSWAAFASRFLRGKQPKNRRAAARHQTNKCTPCEHFLLQLLNNWQFGDFCK